ncbi:MAG: GatB/YqeY domain-containing protein [Patescibacteria group bacterium]
MSLQKKIEEDFLVALKAREESLVSTLRMLKAALQNKKIEKTLPKEDFLPDEEVVAVLKSEIKKRKDSVESYQAAKRDDLVGKEQAEIDILNKYLPPQLSQEQVLGIVKEVIAAAGPVGPADFGKVMGQVMKQLGVQADGQLVSRLVKEELNK